MIYRASFGMAVIARKQKSLFLWDVLGDFRSQAKDLTKITFLLRTKTDSPVKRLRVCAKITDSF
jgi:hypothetical protein